MMNSTPEGSHSSLSSEITHSPTANSENTYASASDLTFNAPLQSDRLDSSLVVRSPLLNSAVAQMSTETITILTFQQKDKTMALVWGTQNMQLHISAFRGIPYYINKGKLNYKGLTHIRTSQIVVEHGRIESGFISYERFHNIFQAMFKLVPKSLTPDQTFKHWRELVLGQLQLVPEYSSFDLFDVDGS
jgi:hypothetical protein